MTKTADFTHVKLREIPFAKEYYPEILVGLASEIVTIGDLAKAIHTKHELKGQITTTEREVYFLFEGRRSPFARRQNPVGILAKRIAIEAGFESDIAKPYAHVNSEMFIINAILKRFGWDEGRGRQEQPVATQGGAEPIRPASGDEKEKQPDPVYVLRVTMWSPR